MRQIKNTILIMVAVVAVVSQLVGQACTLTAPANVTVNSTPGICGANATLASAVAGTACQSVTTVALGSQNFDSCLQPAGWTTGFTKKTQQTEQEAPTYLLTVTLQACLHLDVTVVEQDH